MSRVNWKTIGKQCQAEAAVINAELAAAGLEHVAWSGHHRHDGQVRHIDVHDAEPHEHERIAEHFKRHGRAHRIHPKGPR